jgi:hypothetical protein
MRMPILFRRWVMLYKVTPYSPIVASGNASPPKKPESVASSRSRASDSSICSELQGSVEINRVDRTLHRLDQGRRGTGRGAQFEPMLVRFDCRENTTRLWAEK